jgi:hypothetical protein
MKPNFALSLSFEGITLLHRAAGGWRVVGDVALDAADLGAELDSLQARALRLDASGIRAKLILPNDQIKYLTIATPDQDRKTRLAAARKALNGATPYAVDDLAFDISMDGDQTHIAAVARETLAEAESFAIQYDLEPVSFVAVPDDNPYLGEPYFGPTAVSEKLLKSGETVDPDGIAVVVIGDVDWSSAEKAATSAPATAQAAPEQSEPDHAPSPAPLPDQNATETAPEPAPPAVVLPPRVAPQKTGGSAVPAVDLPAAPAKTEGATAGFASRRGGTGTKAPALGAANRGSPDTSVIAPDSSSFAVPDSFAAPESFSAPAPKHERPKNGFLSRRRAKVAAPKPSRKTAREDETERLTVFGARATATRGRPRFLGLILTVVLLVFLAGVAAWASVFLDDGLGLSRLFGGRSAVETATADPAPVDTVAEINMAIEMAALDPAPGLSDEDGAVLDALRAPLVPDVQDIPEVSQAELEARYATSGIWPSAPQVPPEPAGLIAIDDFYLTSIDPVSTATDAVALPPVRVFSTDIALPAVASPVPAGTVFTLDNRGLVVATPEGAISPDGVIVFLGRPPITPPATPTRFQSEPQDTHVRDVLAAFRPRDRPDDLSENTERAQLDGLTRNELAGLRPVLRPRSVQETARAELIASADTNAAVAASLASPDAIEASFDTATRHAVKESLRPDTRPGNFARIVGQAQSSSPDTATLRVASAAAIAPSVVSPSIPSKASVAKQATLKNAINLRKVNLIGVYGKPSNRRALVRLSNGRYKKVVVGDRIDGGKVSAIGDSELRYTKSGRNVVLKMPKG